MSEYAGTSRSRYPGMRPFSDSPGDGGRFFGRDDEAEQLLLRVLSVPLLVHFGRSGVGKTSLLQAGLFPRLRALAYLPVMIRLNETHDSLFDATQRSMRKSCEAEGLEFAPGDAGNVWDLATTIIWRGDLLVTPVLVFDQFEEVFTLRDAAFRSQVAAEMAMLVKTPKSPVKIVISLREDYLGDLEEFSVAIPSLFHERLRLAPFSRAAAEQAIVNPAALDGPYESPRFRFDEVALESILEYLKGKSGVIEPFQLQLLCGHAEAIATRKRGSAKDGFIILTKDDFAGPQTFAPVLRNFYHDTLAKIPSTGQRKHASRLCEVGLLDDSGHRLMLEKGQILGDYRLSKETLATLCSERLLAHERRHESDFFEISHDRLAESIFAARASVLPKKVLRWLWAAAVIALVLILILSALYIRSIRHERANADRLIAFLLGEQFLGEIRDTGRSSLLALVKERITGSDGVAERDRMNRGLARRNEGDVEILNGNLTDAVQRYEQSLAAFENGSNDTAALRELARTHDRMAHACLEQGRGKESVAHFQAAGKAWRRVIDGQPCTSVSTDCLDLAKSLLNAANAKYAMGDGNVTAETDETFRLASDVLLNAPKKASLYADPAAIGVLASLVRVRATVYGSKEDADGAVPLATEASNLRPQSIQARIDRLAALVDRGTISHADDPQKALDDYREATRSLDELSRIDPNNRIWQKTRAEVQLQISNATLQCHEHPGRCESPESLAEAEAHTLQSLAQFRALAAADTSNVSLQHDVVWALQTHARVVSAEGRHEEAQLDLREVQRFFRAHPGLLRDRKTAAPRSRHAAPMSNEAEARDQRHFESGNRLIATKPAEALRELVVSAAAARDAVRLRPADPNGYTRLQLRYKSIAEVQRRLNDVVGENAALNACVNAAQLAVWLSPTDETRENLVNARNLYGRFLDRTDRKKELVIMTAEALLVEERLLKGSNPDPGALARLGLDQCHLGEERYKLGIPGWEEAIRSGVIRIETAAERDRNANYYYGVGVWRSVLADMLERERPDAARAERRAAIAAYQNSLHLNPNGDKTRQSMLALERRLDGR